MGKKWYVRGWFLGGVVGAFISIILIIQFYWGLSNNSENLAINFFGLVSYLLISLTIINEMGNLGVFLSLLFSSILLILFFTFIGWGVGKLIIKKKK